MSTKQLLTSSLLSLCLLLTACHAAKKGVKNLNLFPVEDDVKLGKQVSGEIEGTPDKYPILPEQSNKEVYTYVRNITTKLLQTGKVAHAQKFEWQVKIIDDNETLNAFATPGGYIYVYTGLIKFLDTEDQLAGVMGHEIAHAAERHSTEQMTRSVGVTLLADALLGKRDAVKSIASGLLGLKFSRTSESEADALSVVYLCETGYNPTGAAGFFRKINNGKGRTPAFLSTHPDPGNRVAQIEAKAKALGCGKRAENKASHQRIVGLLK